MHRLNHNKVEEKEKTTCDEARWKYKKKKKKVETRRRRWGEWNGMEWNLCTRNNNNNNNGSSSWESNLPFPPTLKLAKFPLYFFFFLFFLSRRGEPTKTTATIHSHEHTAVHYPTLSCPACPVLSYSRVLCDFWKQLNSCRRRSMDATLARCFDFTLLIWNGNTHRPSWCCSSFSSSTSITEARGKRLLPHCSFFFFFFFFFFFAQAAESNPGPSDDGTDAGVGMFFFFLLLLLRRRRRRRRKRNYTTDKRKREKGDLLVTMRSNVMCVSGRPAQHIQQPSAAAVELNQVRQSAIRRRRRRRKGSTRSDVAWQQQQQQWGWSRKQGGMERGRRRKRYSKRPSFVNVKSGWRALVRSFVRSLARCFSSFSSSSSSSSWKELGKLFSPPTSIQLDANLLESTRSGPTPTWKIERPLQPTDGCSVAASLSLKLVYSFFSIIQWPKTCQRS